jgi:GTPase
MIFKLNIPVIVVFTKIDLINENDRSNILFIFGKVLKKFKCGKNPLVVKNKDDIVMFSSNMNEGIMPIFLLSNKTGEGLDYLNNFFSILPNKEENKINTNKNNNDINNILNMRFDFLKIHKDEEGKNENKFIVEGIVTQGKIL